jgi:hypothetical protein
METPEGLQRKPLNRLMRKLEKLHGVLVESAERLESKDFKKLAKEQSIYWQIVHKATGKRDYTPILMGEMAKTHGLLTELQQQPNRPTGTQARPHVDPPKTPEVEAVIRRLASGKAPGPDGICNEVWKNVGVAGTQALCWLFECMVSTGIPAETLRSLLIPVYKKKLLPSEDPASYRPISLMNTEIQDSRRSPLRQTQVPTRTS